MTITGCEVSYDRSVCNVFYAKPERYDDVAAAFQKAAGRIRSLMARKLSWRVAPELRFLLDTSVDQAERIASALAADAHRSAVAAPTDSDVPADADAFAAERAQEQAEERSQDGGRISVTPQTNTTLPELAAALAERDDFVICGRQPRRRLHRLAARADARAALAREAGRVPAGQGRAHRRTPGVPAGRRRLRRRSTTALLPRSWRWTCRCATA